MCVKNDDDYSYEDALSCRKKNPADIFETDGIFSHFVKLGRFMLGQTVSF